MSAEKTHVTAVRLNEADHAKLMRISEQVDLPRATVFTRLLRACDVVERTETFVDVGIVARQANVSPLAQ